MPDNYYGFHNYLLNSLQTEKYEDLCHRLDVVNLSSGQTLYEVNEPVTHVYFPENCLISKVINTSEGETIEAGLIGNYGMTGINMIMGIEAENCRTVVDVAGQAYRLKADLMKTEFNQPGFLQNLLQRYVYAFATQLSQTVLCNRLHSIEKRLARWLLVAYDQTKSPNLLLTQELLSLKLGANRPGVTKAAIKLQQAGCIEYKHGSLIILNPKELESFTCECYSTIKRDYEYYLSTVNAQNLTRRIEKNSRELAKQIKLKEHLQYETDKALRNLNRVWEGQVKTPHQVKICSKCQRVCDRNYTCYPAVDDANCLLHVLSFSGICTMCAGKGANS